MHAAEILCREPIPEARPGEALRLPPLQLQLKTKNYVVSRGDETFASVVAAQVRRCVSIATCWRERPRACIG
jgi:hypothetical protein